MVIAVQLWVLFAFLIYAFVVVRWGHHWRRQGAQWLEYVVGALIVVGGTYAEAGSAGAWLHWMIIHYGIAGVVVIPTEIGVAVVNRRRAAAAEEPPHA